MGVVAAAREERRGMGSGIEDERGLAARFLPDSTAHRAYGTPRFLLNVTAINRSHPNLR